MWIRLRFASTRNRLDLDPVVPGAERALVGGQLHRQVVGRRGGQALVELELVGVLERLVELAADVEVHRLGRPRRVRQRLTLRCRIRMSHQWSCRLQRLLHHRERMVDDGVDVARRSPAVCDRLEHQRPAELVAGELVLQRRVLAAQRGGVLGQRRRGDSDERAPGEQPGGAAERACDERGRCSKPVLPQTTEHFLGPRRDRRGCCQASSVIGFEAARSRSKAARIFAPKSGPEDDGGQLLVV